ncbi:unnamed protein product [Blepharisma stoltei]|uniref:Uncharacterized protein n=1 Tax=Blepharisma stoltei TaxID=1481888 RepID=A0AAU9IV93_9CILI|nr:unnamed protein product [Blepharisma stoltei]
MEGIFDALPKLLSSSSSVRNQAEEEINKQFNLSALEFANYLINAMKSENENITILAIILFQRKIIDTHAILSFPSDNQNQIKTDILSLISSTRNLFFTKKLGYLLECFFNIANLGNDYFELLSKYISQIDYKEFAFYLIEIQSDFPNLLRYALNNSSQIIHILLPSLQDKNPNLVISCIRALSKFISSLSNETQMIEFMPLSKSLLEYLIKAINNSEINLEKAKHTLINIAELTEKFPRFWMNEINLLINTMIQIAKNDALRSYIRGQAIEIISTIIQKTPGLLKQYKAVIEEICKCSFSLISEVYFINDIERWNTENWEDDIAKNNLNIVGKELLIKTAEFIGPELVAPFCLSIIPNLINSSEWVNQYTGILGLGIIAGFCKEQFENELENIIILLEKSILIDNPRIKWAVGATINSLCIEISPAIQLRFHASIVQIIYNLLSSRYQKIQCEATKALVSFINPIKARDDIDSFEVFKTYIISIMQVLASIIDYSTKHNQYELLLEAIKSTSILADVLQNNFLPFYYLFMPYLLSVIESPIFSKQNQEIRAEAIRCTGYLVESLSENYTNYIKDAQRIMNILTDLKKNLDKDDPSFFAIFEVISSFAECLKEEFYPYMDSFLPELLENAQLNVNISITDIEEDEDLPPGHSLVKIEISPQEIKKLAIDSSTLQLKIHACQTLYELISALKESYYPYSEITIDTLIPLFSFSYSVNVRKSSVKAVTAIFASSYDKDYTDNLLAKLWPIYTNSLSKPNLVPNDTQILLKGLLFTIHHAGDLHKIGLDSAKSLSVLLSNHAKLLISRKEKRDAEFQQYLNVDLHRQEIELLEKEEILDNKILRLIMEIIGKLLKSFKKDFQNIFLMNFKDIYAQYLFKDDAEKLEILSALCIFIDYVEFTEDLFWEPGKCRIIEQMLKYSNAKNKEIRQSALYGIGVCAQVCNVKEFSIYLEKAIEAVKAAITDPNARSKKYDISTDCAIGALGKIALFHKNELIEEWLNYLPIKAEPEESQNVHKLFLSNYERLKCYPRSNNIISELARLRIDEKNIDILDNEGLEILTQILNLNIS